jgi:hypothetical protein
MDQIARRWCRPTPRPIGRGTCCVEIDKPPDCPDLAIYSQDEQFAAGNPPTWDNPDIVRNLKSAQDVQVTVRNLSPTTSAVNGMIEFSTSRFGIGVSRTVESGKRISLPAAGQIVLPFRTTEVYVPAPQSPDAFVGVHIRLEHPYDSHTINNRGSSMKAEALTSYVGRTFSLLFDVVNQATSSQPIALSLLPNELNARVHFGPATHPIVSPRVFAPLEQFFATLFIQVPNSFHGAPGAPIQKDVTVVGRASDGSVIDGVTCVVRIDN